MRQLKTVLLVYCLLTFLSLEKTNAQAVAVKTNALALAAGGSFNLGMEAGVAKRWTFEVDAIYNPFTFSQGRKTNLWAIQPEIRFWTHYKFTGHFFGLHGQYGQYDWGLWKYRYKGNLYGGGISYGYVWMLGRRWNIEATAGFGCTRLDHDYKYDRKDYTLSYPVKTEDKWGISRLGISIVYLIK